MVKKHIAEPIKDIINLNKNDNERLLLEQWNNILDDAKQTKNYNKTLTYGIFQIAKELNTSHKDLELDKLIYDYPSLNGNINTLKQMIKSYYNDEIVPTLFEYEFLK